ncbi:hypothetical protein [Clostridiisalibacter paucivorans]|nr:hypothetical protein [Clostridiisalibacter paucivorans]
MLPHNSSKADIAKVLKSFAAVVTSIARLIKAIVIAVKVFK